MRGKFATVAILASSHIFYRNVGKRVSMNSRAQAELQKTNVRYDSVKIVGALE